MSVRSKEQLLKLIHEHQQEIQAFGVKRFGLFGSFVRGEPTPQSDIDILVEFEPGKKTFDNFIPERLRQQYPQIEWRSMAGMRDLLIHRYFGVDHEIVVRFARRHCKQIHKNRQEEHA
jgi:predicted nucleotidyltransferase